MAAVITKKYTADLLVFGPRHSIHYHPGVAAIVSHHERQMIALFTEQEACGAVDLSGSNLLPVLDYNRTLVALLSDKSKVLAVGTENNWIVGRQAEGSR